MSKGRALMIIFHTRIGLMVPLFAIANDFRNQKSNLRITEQEKPQKISQHAEHSLFLCVGEPPLVVYLELGVPGDEAEFEV